MLFDREGEKQQLDRLLATVRERLSGALVLRGEAGVGKTALLEYATASADDMLVSHVVGVESEMELGYAGLHQLLIGFLPRLERLPAPQREALGSAFGLLDAAPPDVFLVGLAALTLLADAAVERPVFCVVDDAQWLDRVSAGALGFVARRLLADRIGMLFAVREEARLPAGLEGLTELQVRGLPERAARELLASVAAAGLEPGVGEQIVHETRGNPLALVELGRELTNEELSGGAPLPRPLPIGRRLEERFLSRVRRLPADTQTLMLLASAQQDGDPAQLWRAAEGLGLGQQAADPPELERLLAVEPRVAFRHPLMRSAVYQGASRQERRRAHEALAAAIDPELDPDRRAWHRAETAVAPDEEVAAELERSAERAGRRGGLASEAIFLARAAELSTDDASRFRRLLSAARAEHFAGSPLRALALLDRTARSAAGPLEQAYALWLRGTITFILGDASEATSFRLRAALSFEPLDLRAARETMLDALAYAFWAGPPALRETAMAAKALAHMPESQTTATDLLVDGIAALHLGEWAAAAPLLHDAIARSRAGELSRSKGLGGTELVPAMGCLAAAYLCDLEGWYELTCRVIQSERDIGALTLLPYALDYAGVLDVYCGRFDRAEAHLAAARDVLAATGTPYVMGTTFAETVLLAHRGREAEAREAATSLGQISAARGLILVVSFARAQLCILDLSLGNYAQALAAAREVFTADPPYIGIKALPDLVEAACRAGDIDAATTGLMRLQQRAQASGTPWALGLLARSQALLAQDGEAERLYREALAELTRAGAAVDLARAHLLYGEWLRRRRRRRDAREQLGKAHEMFDTMGAAAFAERARVELLATGEHVRKRTVDTREELTPQEDRVAGLAAEGVSNQQIAAQLFISPSTVAHHLRKVFSKLGVHNRAQLAHVLPGSAETHESPAARDAERAEQGRAALGDQKLEEFPETEL